MRSSGSGKCDSGAVRNENQDRLADQFVARVAKPLLKLRADRGNSSFGIGDDDGIPGLVKKPLKYRWLIWLVSQVRSPFSHDVLARTTRQPSRSARLQLSEKC